jgi:CrcB protein
MPDWESFLPRALWVGLGGFAGANARFWIGAWVQQRMGTAFPWGTFVINITGSFILGLFVTLLTERVAPDRAEALRLLVAVGFVGAYTTFSTFEYETFGLAQTSSLLRAFANALGSLVAGFVAVWLGVALGRLR